MSSRSAPRLVIFAIALALFALPFAPFLTGRDTLILYNALAPDVYYYAAMARNFTIHGFFGIDGASVSNGYMPLWQMIVALLDTAAGPDSPPSRLLGLIFATSLFLTAAGLLGLVHFALRRWGASLTLLTLPLLVPGFAYFAFEPVFRVDMPSGLHYSHSLWAHANGMESGICLLLFALFLPVGLKALAPETTGNRACLIAGLAAFLLVLARLDDVFLGLAFGLLLLGTAFRLGDIRLPLYSAIVPLLGTWAYLWINTTTAGTPLPTSGLLKAGLFSFPNGWDDIVSLGANQPGDARFFPMLGAIVIGLSGLASQTRADARDGETPLILLLSLYLVLKGGFLFVSVPDYHQGYWYYTNMLAAMNLLAIIALVRLAGRQPALRAILPAATIGLVFALTSANETTQQLRNFPEDTYTSVIRDLCQDPEPARRALPPDAKIIDTGDGFYAFCLGRPAVTISGLADSAAMTNDRFTIGFYEAARKRGHNILVDSPVRWASYEWRRMFESGQSAELLAQVGDIRIWRIVFED